jgi:hypothetical protein
MEVNQAYILDWIIKILHDKFKFTINHCRFRLPGQFFARYHMASCLNSKVNYFQQHAFQLSDSPINKLDSAKSLHSVFISLRA